MARKKDGVKRSVEDRLITREEAATLCGVCVVTLWSWEKRGLFPRGRRVGLRRVRYPLSEVQDWLDRQSKREVA